MPMNPDIFSKAMGKPIGSAAPMGAEPGKSMDDIFGEAAENEPEESPEMESAEQTVDPEIMSALGAATPEQLEQVKNILGVGGMGNMKPEGTAATEGGVPPVSKPTSKLGRMLAK